jgi:hypothetical protein
MRPVHYENRVALSIIPATGDGNLPAVRIQFTKQLTIEREALIKVSHGANSNIPLVLTSHRAFPGHHPDLLSSEEEGEQNKEQEFPQ